MSVVSAYVTLCHGAICSHMQLTATLQRKCLHHLFRYRMVLEGHLGKEPMENSSRGNMNTLFIYGTGLKVKGIHLGEYCFFLGGGIKVDANQGECHV